MNANHEASLAVTVDEAGFELHVLKSDRPVVVAFWAPWSRPCHVLEAALNDVAVLSAGRAKVVRVNADDNPELSLWYGVQSVPTLLFFVSGNLSARLVGTVSKEAILAKLDMVTQGGVAKGSPPSPEARPESTVNRSSCMPVPN